MNVEEDPFCRLALSSDPLLLYLDPLACQIPPPRCPPILPSDKPDRARIGSQLLPQNSSSSVNDLVGEMNDLLLHPARRWHSVPGKSLQLGDRMRRRVVEEPLYDGEPFGVAADGLAVSSSYKTGLSPDVRAQATTPRTGKRT